MCAAICAEITQTVIISIADCINWMKSTFFYVRYTAPIHYCKLCSNSLHYVFKMLWHRFICRVRKNPTKYGFEQFADAAQLEDLLCNLCTA